MSVTLKTLGILLIAVVGLVVYLSTFVLGFHVLFYLGLGLTPVFLILLVILSAGRMEGTS
ncbi:MAG: hypothetical protein HQL33_07840 [Alphaproteobacteria bacterium]|nr:hypothetical protein [Alphaproteobacteria bacterium]MBF0129890.1 hypothetical protein [Alphaproteobacteria bacterium]